jgi:hypothetical protein
MMAPTPDDAGSGKPDILTDIVAQVLALGATRFEVNRSYDQENVWAIKGPVDFSVASFGLNSVEGRQLRSMLEKGQTTVLVNGSEYLLEVETADSSGEGIIRATITTGKK